MPVPLDPVFQKLSKRHLSLWLVAGLREVLLLEVLRQLHAPLEKPWGFSRWQRVPSKETNIFSKALLKTIFLYPYVGYISDSSFEILETQIKFCNFWPTVTQEGIDNPLQLNHWKR